MLFAHGRRWKYTYLALSVGTVQNCHFCFLFTHIVLIKWHTQNCPSLLADRGGGGTVDLLHNYCPLDATRDLYSRQNHLESNVASHLSKCAAILKTYKIHQSNG